MNIHVKSFFIFLTSLFMLSLSHYYPVSAQENSIQKAVSLINSGKHEQTQKILLPLVNNVTLKEDKGKALFLLGRSYMKQKNYEAATSYLNQAYSQYPLLGNYIASYMTEAYSNMDKYEEVVEWADKVKSDTLSKQAQWLKIKALVTLDRPDEAIKELDSYIKSYSQDREAKFQLAKIYMQKGQKENAISLLKEIYIESGGASKKAFNALKSMNAHRLTLDENLALAKVMTRRGRFSKAVSIYQKALVGATEAEQAKISFELGMGYFKTKQYPQAASIFRQIDSAEARYWEGRSLFRADMLDAFEELLARYEANYSQHTGYPELLIAFGQELKRLKNYSRSEAILKKVVNNYPAKKEEALWNLGWTYFKNKKYSEAAQCFSEITSTGNSKDLDKYLYWEGISLERAGMDGQEPLKKVAAKTGYYSFLARAKLGEKESPYAVDNNKLVRPKEQVYDLIDELKSLGMQDDAIKEIAFRGSKDMTSQEAAYLYQQALQMDQYRRAIVIANKITTKEHLHMSYPRAYWSIVSREASRHGLDPNIALAIMREESMMDPRATSPVGARGLMQLMPSTARGVAAKLNIRMSSASALYDPEINIKLGTYYFSKMIKDFGEAHLAIASYNAGKRPVNRWIMQVGDASFDEFIEDISYNETRNYVKKVLRSYWEYSKMSGKSPTLSALLPAS